jgi:nitrate/nitrite-specific signal transduction histidine kinase
LLNTALQPVLGTALSIILWAVPAALLPLQSAHAELASMGEAINIAGRQRMLSQRIAQSYLLKGMQSDSERGPQQLQRCVTEFDRNLRDLHQFAPGASLRPELAQVQTLWQDYRRLALAPVSKDSAAELVRQSNTILASAHTYVNTLEKLSGTHQAELINIAGRQRMLSQRIAKNFLAAHWGIHTELSTAALYEDLAEYENMLTYLQASAINTPEINAQLHKVKGHFSYASKGFEGAMALSDARLIHVVTGTTDYMLRGMDITTGLYARLLQ